MSLAPLLALTLAAGIAQEELDRIGGAAGWPVAAVVVVSPGREPELAFRGEGVRADSRFLLGSVSKPLTALVALRLAARGAIDLDAPVRSHLPWLRLEGEPADRPVTVRDLLGHRSGIPRRAGYRRLPDVPPGAVPELGPVPLETRPGEAYAYSNLNYALVGLVVEAVTGRPFGDALHAEVLAPLGMTDTGPVLGDAPGVVPGHQLWFGLPVEAAREVPSRLSAPAGFLATSPRDLARLLAALARGPEGGLLPPALYREMLTPGGGAERGYALGFGVAPSPRGGTTFFHEGMLGTDAATIQLWTSDGLGAGVLTAVNDGVFWSARTDLLAALRRRTLGEPAPGFVPKERLARAALGALVLFGLARLVQAAVRWRRAGRPSAWREPGARRRAVRAALVPVAIAAGLIAWFRPPPQLLLLQPDLALALVLGTIADVFAGVLRAAVARGVRPVQIPEVAEAGGRR